MSYTAFRAGLQFERDQRQQRAAPIATAQQPSLFQTIMIGGGALAMMISFSGKVIENIWFGDEVEVCREAHEAMRDDTLNAALSDEQRSAYLKKQYENAIRCAQRK